MTAIAFPSGARAILFAATLLLTGCGGGGGSDATPTPAPTPTPQDSQFRVSGLTPFAAGCNGIGLGGTLYASAEVEPYVAVNPQDTTNLIGVWQQDRWSNGGAQGVLTGVSSDSGRTWATRSASFSSCTGGTAANGGDYERATDPWVTFAADGNAFQIAITFTGQNFTAGAVNAVLVSRSTNRGLTWSNPVTLIRDGNDFFNDKESITADVTDARYVYAVWDRLSATGSGPTWFARTTDGGMTWDTARSIYDPGPGNQTINNQIVVLPDGALVNFFTRIITAANGSATTSLVVIRSTDKGSTWSAPVVIAANQAIGTRDPEAGTLIRDGAILGNIAAGRNGTLAAVWQDSRFSAGVRDGIAFSRSADGGLTWSTPARVNSVPGVQAFIPAVNIRNDGTIGVTYYDLRSNTNDPTTLFTDYWLARSTDGVNWLETHISGPFDLAIAPNAGGLFLGDYQGLLSIGSVFVAIYAQTNTGNISNRTDVFLSPLNSAATATATSSAAELRAGQSRGDTTVRAAAAPALAGSPELARRLTEAVARTMERRVPGWTSRGIVRATDDK